MLCMHDASNTGSLYEGQANNDSIVVTSDGHNCTCMKCVLLYVLQLYHTQYITSVYMFVSDFSSNYLIIYMTSDADSSSSHMQTLDCF